MVNVKINGKLYPLDQLIDKSVYASKSTFLYRNPGDTTAKFQVAKGGLIGKVYTWSTRTDGIWLGFRTNAQQILKEYPTGWYWVKVSDIDENSLRQQGVKDSATVQKEQEEKQERDSMSFGDKALKTAQNIGLAFVGAMIVKSLISRN